MKRAKIKNLNLLASPLLVVITLLLLNSPVWAGDVDDIAENIIRSAAEVPGLISGISYMFAVFFGVSGIMELKTHVENPSQGSLKNSGIRFAAGGALLGLPIVYEAMQVTIDNGNTLNFGGESDSPLGLASTIIGGLSSLLPTMNINHVLVNIIDSIERIPGFITALAYMLGVLLGALGIMKIKEHVENPQTPLKEGLIRFIIGGMLFAIPTIYDAMFNAIEGDGLGFLGNLTSVLGSLNIFYSSETSNIACSPVGIPILGSLFGSQSVGNVACNVIRSAGALPNFLFSISYVFGLVMGFWALIKIRDHVLNPQNVHISEGITRLLAGGAFFALPILVETARNSLVPEELTGLSTITTNTGFNENPVAGGSLIDSILNFDLTGIALSLLGTGGGGCGAPSGGLDIMMTCFMADVFGPVHVLLNFFTLVAGIIFIMIGISRVIKGTQEGAKGSLGFGTVMTFVAGAALISFNALIRAFSTSLFQNPITYTRANLPYLEQSGALLSSEVAHVQNVISALLKFVILVGLISFIRGVIIVRDVAEGNQQASIMAGTTHIIGGALAVNLGPLLNVIQSSLGIQSIGIVFS